ncbi:MAG: hypothetical protein WCI71_19305 [Bacteroidota bacterium]
MSTVELRQLIAKYLSQIEDVSFLKALKTIIESKVSDGVYKLSDYQRKRIEQAKEQLRNGQTFSDNEVQKEVDLWYRRIFLKPGL